MFFIFTTEYTEFHGGTISPFYLAAIPLMKGARGMLTPKGFVFTHLC